MKMFIEKEKDHKPRFFSLRITVYHMIVFTCMLAISNITQDIFFDMRPAQVIEVTREIRMNMIVTATPQPLLPTETPAYGGSTIPCEMDVLKASVERGG